MKVFTLRIHSHDHTQLLAELRWKDGSTRLVHAHESLRSEMLDYVECGLAEWVDLAGDPYQRITPPSDAAFLPRLEANLRAQSSLPIETFVAINPEPAVIALSSRAIGMVQPPVARSSAAQVSASFRTRRPTDDFTFTSKAVTDA
jgi:hypothetical protein